MAILARSSLLLLVGFAAGIGASTAVAVFAAAGHVPVPAPVAGVGHYSVSIDEIRQNLVPGDFFNDHYTHTVTLSDGSVHRVTLTAAGRHGQPMLQLIDASGDQVARSIMGPFGTMTVGRLMVSVKDADELRAQMHRATGR